MEITAQSCSLKFCQRLAHYRRCALDIGRCVGRRNESGLKLRWREVNAALQTSMEKSGEHFQVASLRAGEIDDWTRGKEHTKHRTVPVKRDLDLRVLNRVSRQLFELRAQFFERFPAVD